MDKIHLVDPRTIGPEVYETRLKLKPVVIALGVAIGASGSLTGCSSSNSYYDGGTPGDSVVDTSGGTGHSPGGDGGDIIMYAGADDAVIEVLTGTAGVPGMSTLPASPAFGANPWVVGASMTLQVTGTEPAMGEYYQVPADCQVYMSDGNTTAGDESPVTGIDIQSGAVLSLSDNSGTTTCLSVASDINNDDGLATASPGSDIYLYVDNYFGTGPIGASTNMYGDAGDIFIRAATSIYNAGDLTAKGADSSSADAGDGGDIELYADGANLWNSGTLDNRGGSSTFGQGGDSGYVYLFLSNTMPGSLISAGEIFSQGGDGETGGGSATNYPWLNVGYHATVDNTDMHVTASIHAGGGNGVGTPAAGGDGGTVYLYNQGSTGGKIVLHGFRDLITHGGDGSTSGGDGGDIELYTDGYDIDHFLSQAKANTRGGDATEATGSNQAGDGGDFLMWTYGSDGTMEITNDIETAGGSATSGYGGDGGNIQLYRDGNNNSTDNRISSSGMLATDGGDGTDGGGDGGDVELYNYMDTAGTDDVSNSGPISTVGGNATTGSAGSGGDVWIAQSMGAGDVSNTAPITTTGGNSDSGSAGNAGDIEIEIEDGDGFVSSNQTLTAAGGNSNTGSGGIGGHVEVEQESSDSLGGTTAAAGSGSSNSGAIAMNGGSGAYGGDGGDVNFYSPGLPSSNSGSINGQGGDGSVDGGDGGDFLYAYGEPFTNSAPVDLSGGNGTSGYGGDGGDADMYSTGGTTTSNGSTVNTSGGTGALGDGLDGTFTKDSVVQ